MYNTAKIAETGMEVKMEFKGYTFGYGAKPELLRREGKNQWCLGVNKLDQYVPVPVDEKHIVN